MKHFLSIQRTRASQPKRKIFLSRQSANRNMHRDFSSLQKSDQARMVAKSTKIVTTSSPLLQNPRPLIYMSVSAQRVSSVASLSQSLRSVSNRATSSLQLFSRSSSSFTLRTPPLQISTSRSPSRTLHTHTATNKKGHIFTKSFYSSSFGASSHLKLNISQKRNQQRPLIFANKPSLGLSSSTGLRSVHTSHITLRKKGGDDNEDDVWVEADEYGEEDDELFEMDDDNDLLDQANLYKGKKKKDAMTPDELEKLKQEKKDKRKEREKMKKEKRIEMIKKSQERKKQVEEKKKKP